MIWDLLMTPEAQAGWYDWAAVFLAHFAIGLFAQAVLWWAVSSEWIEGPEHLAAGLAIGAFAIWEGAQFAFFEADLIDNAVDLGAFSLGVMVAIAAWNRQARSLFLAFLAGLAVLLRGIARRR